MYDLVYIWRDSDDNFRSKTRRVQVEMPTVQNVPEWNYDGSSTGQATTADSEIVLKPIRVYTSDLVGSERKAWVLCGMYKYNGQVVSPNCYDDLIAYKADIDRKEMVIGFEQEFYIFDSATKLAYQFDKWRNNESDAYYCSVGCSGNGFIANLVQQIYERACVLGVHCSGWNLEVAPSQGEIQVCAPALTACHDIMFLRYLIWDSLCSHGLYPVFHPKPLGPNWSGSGLHANISTCMTMKDGGYRRTILRILDQLKQNHTEHMHVYGKDNHLRLTGMHETSSIDEFTWGVASRSSSVRIPNKTAADGCGYFEDRRPAANADPYSVCLRMWKTICEAERNCMEILQT